MSNRIYFSLQLRINMTDFFHPQAHHVLKLLQACELPTADLDEDKLAGFLACGDPENPDGVIGLEVHSSCGLLRSLAVSLQSRNSGNGRVLVDALEHLASSNGIETLYLLTTTAESFFQNLGYRTVERSLVPDLIQETVEFSSLCPDDATVMKKDLKIST